MIVKAQYEQLYANKFENVDEQILRKNISLQTDSR